MLEAKRWARDLDTRDPEGADRLNQVPSTQIINYLIRAEQPWGVLTNGVQWRLYYRDADFADTSYFSVDLPTLLSDDPLAIGERGETIPPEEAFRYFYLFFRPEAFRTEVEGRRWLDLARQASVRYARAVEEALKPRAYRAVEAICRGFAAAQSIEPSRIASDPALANHLLDNALTLLFRLLFLLYAESRDLLPVRTSPAYRRKSLLQLRERAARTRDSGEALFPRGRDFWNDLHDLFRIVDGDPAWRAVEVPVYNGGLFDPARHPWLEENYVADPALAEALDLLSRAEDPSTDGLHYVDYGPLDVRNLGSIYEGLLEHSLGEGIDRELVLVNDRGERKVTGSFYTPHYVVEYIVGKTLEPLIEGRTPREILELRVVDPAMGSGHFLVSATSFLARAAVRAVEEEPASLGDLARLDPERLRRLVVERCIFGVDRNPRAVELAKLSLWIATVQRDKPLNFVDHHLKAGDSLLGAKVDRLGRLPGRRGKDAVQESAGQINAFESAFQSELAGILDSVQAIETGASDTLSDIERKEELHRRAESLSGRFRTVADLWCGGQVVQGPPLRGIVTGLNEAFFLDDETRDRLVREDPQSAEVIQPLVVGSEVGRYHLERESQWLLYLPHGVDISRYPAVERHLAPFRERLEKRATKQAWYELQQPQEAYRPYFEGPKILYPEIAMDPRFAFDPGPLYANNKCFLIPGENYYLLALLNSRVGFFYLQQILARLEGPSQADSYLEFRAQYMERLPIRRVPETTPPGARRELGEWLRSLYFRGLRLAGIEPELPPDVRELGPRIGELEGIERVVLIGSWARGHASADSDIDLVVVHQEDGSKADQRARIREHLRDFPRPFDLHLYTPEEIRARQEMSRGFLAHALPEGMVLYGS